MSRDLSGLRAVITGTGSGIGLATALMMHAEGVEVVGLDIERGKLPDSVEWMACDVSSDQDINTTFAALETSHDHLDIVVNCAGIGAIGTIEAASHDEWTRLFETNVFGTARVSSRALPLLRKSTSASIVNVSSIAATVGLPERAVYSASKGAVLSLTRAMAADLITENIRVNCVSPGTVDTPWIDRLLRQAADPAAERQALTARQPMGRLVTADEVASAICFLTAPAQSSTTGISLAIDGGMDGLRTKAKKA